VCVRNTISKNRYGTEFDSIFIIINRFTKIVLYIFYKKTIDTVIYSAFVVLVAVLLGWVVTCLARIQLPGQPCDSSLSCRWGVSCSWLEGCLPCSKSGYKEK
jgi:hypothetical protein